MCGIWAVLNKHATGFNGIDVDHMKAMAILTSLRGDHSSGLFVVGRDAKKLSMIVKMASDPFGIFHSTNFDSIHKAMVEGEVVVGHGRYATKGKINAKNAHPFREGNITLVHNGTTDLVSTEKDVKVDSHVLCQNISKVGVEQALKDLGQNYSNAYAIMLHDSETGKIYIARNASRPLHYMETTSAFYVMSDADHLALFKAKYQTGGGLIKSFGTEEIYSFDVAKRAFDQETVSVKKVYTFPVTTPSSRETYYNGWERGGGGYVPEDWHKNANGVWQPKKTYLVKPDPTPEPAPMSHYPYAKGDTIEFEVMSVGDMPQASTMYAYEAVDFLTTPTRVIFYTNKFLPEHVGRFGTATVANIHKYPDGHKVQVRYKEIVWESEDTESPSNETVTTFTGDKLFKSTWVAACDKLQCETCRGKLDVAEPEKCVIDEGPPVRGYCQDCVSGMAKEESATSRALGIT